MELNAINKVIIIDDQIEEALPIMKALSTKGIYSLFWDGQLKNKPEEPLNGVRLVILDMRFSTVTDSHIINRSLFSLLKRAISLENGPYILCMWSKHNNEYLASFKEELKEYPQVPQPYLITSLEKKDFISLIRDSHNEARDQLAATISSINDTTIEEKIMDIFNMVPSFSEHEEVPIDNLLTELNGKLKEMNALSSLLVWENTVSKAANMLLNSVAMLSDKGDNWNKNVQNIIQRLAIANAGKILGTSTTNAEYISNAFASLNQMLPDELWNQMHLIHFDDEEFQHMTSSSITCLINQNEYSISKIGKFVLKKNGRDFISYSKIIDKNVVTHEDKEIIEEMHNKYLRTQGFSNSKLLCQKILLNDNKKPGKLFLVDDKEIKEEIVLHTFDKVDINDDQIGLVKLDISSSCDYAQNKLKRKRILFGIKVPVDQFNKRTKSLPESLYSTPELLINDELCIIVFSFHHISNDQNREFTLQPLLEFRELFLSDIKHYLSTFISRVGIIRLD